MVRVNINLSVARIPTCLVDVKFWYTMALAFFRHLNSTVQRILKIWKYRLWNKNQNKITKITAFFFQIPCINRKDVMIGPSQSELDDFQGPTLGSEKGCSSIESTQNSPPRFKRNFMHKNIIFIHSYSPESAGNVHWTQANAGSSSTSQSTSMLGVATTASGSSLFSSPAHNLRFSSRAARCMY